MNDGKEITWQAEVSTLSGYLLKWPAILCALGPVVLLVMVGAIVWAAEGKVEWNIMAMMAASVFGAALLIFGLVLLLMRLVHGKKYVMAFRLDENGVSLLETRSSRKDQRVMDAAVAVGASEHLSAANWQQRYKSNRFLSWDDVTGVKGPDGPVISLKRGMLLPVRLYCPEAGLRQQVVEMIRQRRGDLFS